MGQTDKACLGQHDTMLWLLRGLQDPYKHTWVPHTLLQNMHGKLDGAPWAHCGNKSLNMALSRAARSALVFLFIFHIILIYRKVKKFPALQSLHSGGISAFIL